jgi:hypothetical protein
MMAMGGCFEAKTLVSLMLEIVELGLGFAGMQGKDLQLH